MEGAREGGGEGREGRLKAGLTCVGYAVMVGLCDLALLKVLMRPDGVVDVRGTQNVVSPTSTVLQHPPPAPLPVAGRRGGGGRGSGEAEP